ncbi:uncharacterized protein prr14 [Anabas testudineus]|uniref:uncharacterized protein prr14 n=1 Tax=Anabas testudineus TaxID=64144 RepID=UPI000E463B55|nr:uncharacterized protein prr14 [Anabas testudineus]
MLTYPCDSVPQIVCPMAEDAIPPNPFCSAPPHSEPPPPLLPLSSITPSLANYGIPTQRRSGRIQGVRSQTPKKQSNTDSGAAQNPSPTKRQREGGSMVQVLQSKQPTVESTIVHAKQNEDFNDMTECQNKKNVQKNPHQTNVPAAENVDEQFADNTTHSHTDTAKSDMDTGIELDTLVENASVPKGWVIGPLFQSFKSKMASFTEIVMSPVKLFRANSPPPSMDHPEKVSQQSADGLCDFGYSEPSSMLHPDGQTETSCSETEANQQRPSNVENTQDTKTVAIKYCKKLVFDKELLTRSTEKANECAITQKETNGHDSVPLQHSSLPCFVFENVSESVESAVGPSILLQSSVNESKLELSSAIEEQKGVALLKPLPRKCTGNRSELKKFISKSLISDCKKQESDIEASGSTDINKTVPLSLSGCYTQPDTDCLQMDDENNGSKIENCRMIRQSLRNNLNSANGRTLKPSTDVQQLGDSTAGVSRAKRGQKQQGHSQVLMKRKKRTGEICTDDTRKQELLNVPSDSGIWREPPRREAVLTSTIVDTKETLKPARKRKDVSTRTNKKGKGGQEMLPTVNEALLKTKTESSPEAMVVCSLDKSTDLSITNQNVCSSSKMKPRLKTKVGLVKPNVSIDDSMDLETTVAISSTKQVEEELLSDVLVCPGIKQLQTKRRNTNKKTLKRKSPVQASSVTESNSTLVSTSSVPTMEPSELMATDFNISLSDQKEEKMKTGLNQPSKRPKKGLEGAFKSESGGAQKAKQCMNNINLISKESQSQEGKSKTSNDPVYFEMTPSESNHQPGPSSSQTHPSCSVLLNNEVKHVVNEKEKSPDSVLDEVFSTDLNVSRLRSSARRVNIKPRRADNQRRKCRVLHSRTCNDKEVTNSVTMEDTDLATTPKHPSEKGFSRCLLRSHSCPEIPSFRSHETPWTPSLHSPHHSRTSTSHQHQPSHTPHVPHAHKSALRARRHTVCSVEVEREIAPLCLRKEVYPSRRSAPYDGVAQYLSPTLALSPSTTLSALASCFLSSPLAFLSKKTDRRSSASSPSKSSHVSSPTSSSSTSPLTPSTWHFPGFLQSGGTPHATLDSSNRNPLVCESERRQQCEEEEFGEDTGSSSQEYEDVGLREEKALSDSEIKVVQKHEERGKVSSIRIRKTLPKPQNNLTPMGLPKPIRLKKKEFSLEEIYTNKNFSKPPESRLETIFEVPLNRRNGSESWFGQRRVKRFLEFLEVGEARKPKRPLVGIGKTGVLSSRTRRGGFTKDEPSLPTVQDVDSMLCAKLDELNLWLIHDQNS